MEADFARFYGIDFADYYRGRLTLRRVRSLVHWLPYESAVAKIVRDVEEQAEQDRKTGEVENALAMFQR